MSIAAAATLACIDEATAPKPGNVHRGADFEDLTYVDLVHSAVIVGPILGRAAEVGVGRAVLDAVIETRDCVGTNTNLGTLLLLAPLAAVRPDVTIADGIGRVLAELRCDDTRLVFEAIRVSGAGGLGQVNEADVSNEPPPGLGLVEAMRLARERDLVARQYCIDFADVFKIAMWIEEGVGCGWALETAIVYAHIQQMAEEADSLIRRKLGPGVAEQARTMAGKVLEAGLPGEEAYERGLADLDFWLRLDGHRRNPGTTADLIAAAMFVLLREGRVK
jgi:triphosphoribosyl-dephospho-CoA synthase